MFRLAVMWLVGASAALAQTPTLDELEIFRNLTPEQQQAVLEGLEESGGIRSRSPGVGSGQRLTGDVAGGATQTRRADERRRELVRESVEPEIPTMQPLDTVLLEVAIRIERGARAQARSPAEEERLERLLQLLQSRNPYTLDRNAHLILPGFTPIALGGLNEEQASQRLSLEPVLLPFEVKVTRLPLAKIGVAGLKPFGYDLFENAADVFSPITDVPVPADYVVGPGDELEVQLFGSSQNRTFRLTVNRDGTVSFPELGPIRVAGMTFNAARQTIESRVSQQIIGVQASVSMGEVRTIRVFVSGDARQPGSYPVNGLATMTTALFASGGVKEIGSLRDIQLKRQGEVVARLDLYDLLIRGDTSADAKLLPGDVIFIPPVGATISVEGEVKRPAIYELRGESSVADVVGMAGGLTAEADLSRVNLTRIDRDGRRVVIDVNMGVPNGAAQGVGNGDVLRIARLRPQIDAGVELEGFVYRPGPVAWRDGMRLSDVIGSVDELKPNADLHYILIRRETGADRRVSFVSADLTEVLAAPRSDADVALMPRDRILVFDLAPGRERIIGPLLDELELQSDLTRPTEIVQVGGRVKAPGRVPLEPGMRIVDLLRAGGGLDPAAYGSTAELARSTVNDAGERRTELIDIDLSAVRRGDPAANLALMPFDYLVIKETPDWSDQESVTLRGEVRFPGTYVIRKGETLGQVLERAGGLTPLAFPEGSAFLRQDLRDIEQRQLDRLAERMRADLAALALQAANAGQTSASESLQAGQGLLAQLESAKATGRFVIDLPGLIAQVPGGTKDVVLRDGDELLVPRLRQEVTVIGEVQNPTTHLYQPDLHRNDYISMSGGATRRADRNLIHIVRADGSVAPQRNSWFRSSYNVAVKPGDTIVVPMDTERMPRLPFWQAVTQILYNVAVSVAAVNSF